MKESTLQCHVADCDKPSKCHGYCAKHYTRFYRHGDPLVNLHKGVKKHPLYGTWLAMKNRCYNPNSEDWPRYGGRGIRVCDKWRDDFCAFADDMGERPDDYTLDRIDFNGDYCPENCRWANKYEQAWNKSNTRGKLRGVKKTKSGYRARISYNCHEISKSFATVDEAIAYRAVLEAKYGR